MKYCFHCGRATAGDPLFCHHCGRTYDRKLCPRLHPNPRFVDVCARCGSRELSTPQPKVSWGWHLLVHVLRVVSGAVLVLLTVALGGWILAMLFTMQAGQNGIVALGFLLIALWALWTMLPDWLRKSIHHRLERRKERPE